MLAQTRFDIAQHQFNNPAHLLRGERLEDDSVVQSVQELRVESAAQRVIHRSVQAGGVLLRSSGDETGGAAARFRCAEVAGHYDERIAEIDCPAVPVREPSVFKYL